MKPQSVTDMTVDKRKQYQQYGYTILPNLVPEPLIQNVLTCYARDIVPSQHPFFRQSTYSYAKNELNEFEYVKESFLDIHDYHNYPEFSRCVREILCGSEILDTLKQLLSSSAINLVQSMLFDANTGTFPHQEWWYLDTVPNGHLAIAWIALEDIDERAGRFYVLPKSPDNLDFHSAQPNISHQEWLERIKAYVDTHQYEIQAPALKRGDVLFLNSQTIHGSLPTIDPQFSRKSITAHYIPSTYEFGNLFRRKQIAYKSYNNVNCYSAHPEYSVLNQLNFKINHFLRSSPVLKPIRRIKAALER